MGHLPAWVFGCNCVPCNFYHFSNHQWVASYVPVYLFSMMVMGDMVMLLRLENRSFLTVLSYNKHQLTALVDFQLPSPQTKIERDFYSTWCNTLCKFSYCKFLF